MRIIICGPNLRDQSKGSFHVHAEGCADLKRSNEPEYSNGWTINAENRVQVCDDVYPPDEFECESGDPLNMSDLHFFPCCAMLPEKEE